MSSLAWPPRFRQLRRVSSLALLLLAPGCGRSDLWGDVEQTDASRADGGPRVDGSLDVRPSNDAPGDGRDVGPGAKDALPDGIIQGGTCRTSLECAAGSPGPCYETLCIASRCTYRPLDRDRDGFPDRQCGGTDCDDSDPRVFPGAIEQCRNGRDDNCDRRIDCADPTCASTPACQSCVPDRPGSVGGIERNCVDGRDNDCNGLTDCADPSCRGTPACTSTCERAERCDNGRDDDCNGLTDCADPACSRAPNCLPCGPAEICGNGRDDDCNGLTDCGDPTCAGSTACACATVETCGNGRDDDCNGLADCSDPACRASPTCACAPAETCGNGRDDDCNGLTDCSDPACRTAPGCSCEAVETCDNGKDDDCNGRVDCQDPTCATTAACSCRLQRESCSNGVDDNCNGLSDCFDPQCATDEACLCEPGAREICGNGKDDDCNGRVDCADPLCVTDPSCRQCRTEACGNGQDDDCNQLVDCSDQACLLDEACRFRQEVCDNFRDDNGNGLTDCEDPACQATDWCRERHELCATALTVTASGTYVGDTTTYTSRTQGSCGGAGGEAVFRIVLTTPSRLRISSSGTLGPPLDSVVYLRRGSCEAGAELGCDDDSGDQRTSAIEIPVAKPGVYWAFLDGFTYADVGPYQFNVEVDPLLREDCGNRTDDDGNGLADCADPACRAVPACAGATPELGVGACTDGVDNDLDGLADCDDPDCNASRYYRSECCNGLDDNGNGIVDEFACHCTPTSSCDGGALCNWETTESCAIPCTSIVGQSICPAVAPGSSCDPRTGLCSFSSIATGG